MFTAVFFCMWMAILALTGILMTRNEMVFRWRKNAIDNIVRLQTQDIINHVYDTRRWEEFNQVDYFQQAIKFWRSINSFYDESYDWLPK